MKSPSLLGGPGGKGVGVGVGTGVGDSVGTAVSAGVTSCSPITGSQTVEPPVDDGVVVETGVEVERRHADTSAIHADAPTPRRKSRLLTRRADEPPSFSF